MFTFVLSTSIRYFLLDTAAYLVHSFSGVYILAITHKSTSIRFMLVLLRAQIHLRYGLFLTIPHKGLEAKHITVSGILALSRLMK